MKKRIVLSGFILLGILISNQLSAQYNPNLPAYKTTEVGIRIGGTTGITGKYFFRDKTAVEGILGFFGNGFSLTGMVEKQLPIYNVEGLFVYYGGGAHMAFYNGNPDANHFGREVDNRNTNNAGFGIDGLIGIEYRLPKNIPVAFSADLKPFAEVGSGGYVSVAPDPSIGIKFIIR